MLSPELLFVIENTAFRLNRLRGLSYDIRLCIMRVADADSGLPQNVDRTTIPDGQQRPQQVC